jgi:hypothetical protein
VLLHRWQRPGKFTSLCVLRYYHLYSSFRFSSEIRAQSAPDLDDEDDDYDESKSIEMDAFGNQVVQNDLAPKYTARYTTLPTVARECLHACVWNHATISLIPLQPPPHCASRNYASRNYTLNYTSQNYNHRRTISTPPM